MPRRVMLTLLVICGVFGSMRDSAAQPNTILNITALPSPCPSAPPNTPGFNSSNAFDCAVLLLPANGGEIYVPAGKYYLTRPVNVVDRNVMFRGEGRRISTLIWTGVPSDGLSFTSNSTAANFTFSVQSLSLLRGGPVEVGDGRAAIRGQWKPIVGPNGHREHGVVTTTIHDVQIGSEFWDPAGAVWTFGIELVDSTAANINQFDIQGRAWDVGIAAIQIGGGASPVEGSKSIGPMIRDGRINRYARGIEARNNPEGVHVEYVTMQEVGAGIQITNGTGTALTNNRIYAVNRGVQLINSRHIAVSHNRIEQLLDAEFAGVHLLNCAMTRATANSITSAGGAQPRKGIWLQGDSDVAVIQQNTTENMEIGIFVDGLDVDLAGLWGNINRTPTVIGVQDNGDLTYPRSNH